MKAVFLYSTKEGAFRVYQHDLDDRQAQDLAVEFRSQGREVFIVDQFSAHGGESRRCQQCRQAGAKLVERQPGQEGETSDVVFDAPIDGALGMVSLQEPPAQSERFKLNISTSLYKVIPLGVLALLLLAGWFCVSGPLAPKLEGLLSGLFARSPSTPVAQVSAPTLTPAPSLPADASAVAVVAKDTATAPAATATAAETPTQSPSQTPVVTEPPPTPTQETGCRRVEDVTLEDVGKTLCVRGKVSRAYQEGNSFYIIFVEKRGFLYGLSYDRVWTNLDEGTCYQVTAEIQQLATTPIMILGYQHEFTPCP